MVTRLLGCSVAGLLEAKQLSKPATQHPSNLLPPPAGSCWSVLQNNSARQQLAADAVGLREVPRAPRRIPRLEQFLDALAERIVAAREEIEHRIHPHQGSFQPLGIARGDAAGIDGNVCVANQREQRAEGGGGV